MLPLPHLRRRRSVAICLGLLAALALPTSARAGSLSWLDEVVQNVMREARAGGRASVKTGEEAGGRVAGRLFVHEADEGLEVVARRYENLAEAGRRLEEPSDALLRSKFTRLLPQDAEAARVFGNLKPAEKRLVVEMSETAQRLARRYPDQAETMVRKLGTEGLSAVRVYGDDVAEVLVKEGPETLGVLRKTGRNGWKFLTKQVLPHKKKLMAAGVLAAFLANPDKFVDYAGQATEYAVREFGKAGVQLAGAIGGGATRGLESSISEALAARGLDFLPFRYLGMALAGLVVVLASMVVLGLPISWFFKPFTWPVKALFARRKPAMKVG
ncbi:hypothetical protein [Singulisphaera sp. PoT]|uniref:hypothetical protein n=1 Tax=Singulisphaera sp. PoT TaxID=3411797 RepID=UPI003BF49C63